MYQDGIINTDKYNKLTEGQKKLEKCEKLGSPETGNRTTLNLILFQLFLELRSFLDQF
jgi:hypothetical protein